MRAVHNVNAAALLLLSAYTLLLPPPPQLPLANAVFIPQVEMMMMAGHVAETDLKRFSHLLAYASLFDLFFLPVLYSRWQSYILSLLAREKI